jgi:SWI/SNF-related matrix-associated actin-dependent regulator 1 of chromatin subfamily A
VDHIDNNNFDDEEAQLLAQLEAVRNKKREAALRAAEEAEKERKRKEAETPVTVTLVSTNGSTLILRVDSFREDVVAAIRTVPGRLYNSLTKSNSIPIGEWKNLKAEFLKLPLINVEANEAIESQIYKILNQPNFEIKKATRYLTVETNATAATYELRFIPGYEYDYRQNCHIIPLTEAWRLWDFVSQLDPSQTVIWDEESREFVAKQVEQRMMLDKIALAKDWPLEVPGLKITLKPFQRVGTAFFTVNSGSGILADEMGLGKSAQAIALSLIRGKKTLLVVPASLKINWIREIQKFTSEKSYTLSGTTPQLYDVATILSKDCPKFVIINYDILGANAVIDESFTDEAGVKHIKKSTKFPWVEILNMVNFDNIFYDEGHYIKNEDSNRSTAARKLVGKNVIFLTGTPVLNRPGELWPMLHIIDPKTFPSSSRFLEQYTYDGKTTRNVNELREVLKPLMIRRLKKDVYDELPPLNRIVENYELTPRAQKLYQRALQGVYEVVAMWNPAEAGNEKKIQNILVQIQRLKQIAAIDKVPATADLATRIFDSSDPAERPKKVIIFSQFKPTAYAIKTRLGHEAIGFVSRSRSGEFVTADSKEQDDIVQRFQNEPDLHYLCVTEKTAKEGHNITQAMAVIFNDLFWTPAAHQQSEGRAYMRNNDPHGIDSYYHVATETIDEWIQALLAAKLKIIEEVVDGVNDARVAPDESIVKELIQMIKDGTWKR